MNVASRLPFLALLAVTATGCADDRSERLLPVAPSMVAPNELSAYVVVSDPRPAIGSRFTASVHARRGSAVGRIGSFTIQLTFDTTRLRFHEAARSEQGMVMANGAKPGVLIAAGAAADGFTSDELLSVTFSALSPDALKSLVLSVTELNSVSFENQRALVRISPTLYRDAPRRK